MSKKLIGAAILASLALAGCGTYSQVDDEGHTDQVVFPDLEKDKPYFKTGSYPNLDNLRQVHAGVTRDQLYDLLGRPHFPTAFRSDEWDYLFHFNTPEGVQTCQYKILFDKDWTGQSFYWKPAACADILNGKSVKPFSLSGDVGFGFGSAVLTTAGVNAVRNIANQLKQAPEGSQITVSGHTDYIGNDDANQLLSQQRAEAVRQALVEDGVSAASIQAQGFGESRPVVRCDQEERSELIACLAPNRRVEIDVQASSK